MSSVPSKLLRPRRQDVRLLIVIAAAVGLGGCKTAEPLARTVSPQALQQSDALRKTRAQAAAVPLEQRIAAIEAAIQRELVPIGEGALAPHYLHHNGRKGPLQLEINAALLSAVAAKYAATGDEQAKALGEQLIKGIIQMDARNGGLDGLVAFELHPATFQPTHRPTNANAYTQLLFAYVAANECFGPNEDIRTHVSHIYERFAQSRFRLRQSDGDVDRRADLNVAAVTFNARRALDRRLLDAAAHHLGDAKTRELVDEHRWRGALLGPKHLRLLDVEVPTASSSWLNLQAMTALSMLGEGFEDDAVALAEEYQRDNNPFFRLLAALVGADEDLAAIRSRLEEFPYPATNAGIINSHRADLRVVRGDYVKFAAVPETRQPLPLHEIASHEYLWKRRLRSIDSQPIDKPRVLLGYDLYQAYWFLRMLEERRAARR